MELPKIVLLEGIANYVMFHKGVYFCCAQMSDGTPEKGKDGFVQWGEMLDTGEGISLQELNEIFEEEVDYMPKPCPALTVVNMDSYKLNLHGTENMTGEFSK